MPALCIVATPLAASRAARRLCDAQGGLLFGPRVSTLERIVPGILAASGDRRAVLSPLAERLLAARAAEAAGAPLAGAAPDGGLAAAVASALRELRRGEVAATEASAAASALAGAGGPGTAATFRGGPAERLAALARALESYEAALQALDVLDRAGAVRAAADAARRGAVSAETEGLDLLVVDGIHAASPAEWDLLAALAARAARTRFHVPFLPERADLCGPAEALLRRVESLHEVAASRHVEVVLPALRGDGRSERTAALVAAFGGGRAPAGSPVGGGDGGAGGAAGLVVVEPGAGEAGEADAVARAVERLAGAGLDPGEIAVIVPAPRRSAPALARSFAASGIPFAAGRGAPLAEAPPVRVLLDAIAAAGGLDRSGAERLSASSYLAPAGAPEALGPLLDRSGSLDGRAAPRDALRARAARLSAPSASAERDALCRAAAALDVLEASLRPLRPAGTGREHAARIAAFVDASGLRRRAARAPDEVAGRDLAALAGLVDAADGLARALALAGRGAERIASRDYRALLALALSEASLPPPPEPAAGAVELYGLDEAPGLLRRGAVLAGCAHGAWPVPPPPEPLLREPERHALNRQLRRSAVATGAARRAEAAFQAFSAAAAGAEAVAFAWAARGPAGDGAPLAPLVSDALAALGEPAPGAAPPEPPLAAARTERAALRAAVREGPLALHALRSTLLAARVASALARGRVERARREAVRARRATAHAGAVGGAARAALLSALPDEWSPTQLEEYARCPFRVFLRTAVRIDEPGPDGLDVDPRDEGSLLHAVLERFVRSRTERRAWPPAGSEEDLAEARAAAADVFERFEREGRTGDPAVWAAHREAVLARLDRVVRAEARDHGGLAPALLEHAFGGRSGRPPVTVTAGGEAVALRGRIDRVDAGPDRLLVIDYKNSRGGRSGHADLLDPEAFGETSFQIPVYLLAALRELPGRPRAAATYALLRTAERLDPVELDAADPALADAAAPADAAGGRRPFAAAVVEMVRRIRGGDFPIASRSCERCAFGAVCRFEGTAAGAGDEGRASA